MYEHMYTTEWFQPLPYIILLFFLFIVLLSSSIYIKNETTEEVINVTSNYYFRLKALMLSISIHICFLLLWYGFDTSFFGYQDKFTISLVIDYNINFSLGLDGISLVFILLTTFIMVLCILNVNLGMLKFKEYIVYLLTIDLLLILTFLTTDIFCFYIFFESVLIPMFIIIGIWGSRARKSKAAFYLFLYTLFGSFFLLFGIFELYGITGSTSYEILLTAKLNTNTQLYLWFCFFIPFAIKIPMVPTHIWLPEAHVEAPTIGSVILASLLLKLGGYGFLRFTVSIFPLANIYYAPIITTLCVLGIIFASLATFRQVDLKRIIAYASIAHMNVVVLGLFSYTQQGLDGAIYLMIAHGLTSGGLFFLVGALYERYKSRLIEYYGGLVQVSPVLTLFFCLFSFANMGFPGTSNFIGEFITLVGIFETNIFVMFFATTGVIFSAVYSIWLFNRICFGTLKIGYIKAFSRIELTTIELSTFLVLSFFTIFFGLTSSPITDLTAGPVQYILTFV